MKPELVTNKTLKEYQHFFMMNKSVEGIKACIRDIFSIQLNSYCNIISGETISSFASEELIKAQRETMDMLRTKLDDFYFQYSIQVKAEDINVFSEIKVGNTLKVFVEYLIIYARDKFDTELTKLKDNEFKK